MSFLPDFEKVLSFLDEAKKNNDPRLSKVSEDVGVLESGLRDMADLLGVDDVVEAAKKAVLLAKLFKSGGLSTLQATASDESQGLNKTAFWGSILKGITSMMSLSEIANALEPGALELLGDTARQTGLKQADAEVLKKIYDDVNAKVDPKLSEKEAKQRGKFRTFDQALRHSIGDANASSFNELFKRHKLDILKGKSTHTIGSRLVKTLGGLYGMQNMPENWRHLPFSYKIIPTLRILLKLIPTVVKIAAVFGGIYTVYKGYEFAKEKTEDLFSDTKPAEKTDSLDSKEEEPKDKKEGDLLGDLHKHYESKRK